MGAGQSLTLTFVFFLLLHIFIPKTDFASVFSFFSNSPYFLSLLFLCNVFFSSYFSSNYSKELTLYLLSPHIDYNTYILFTENKIYLRAGFLSILFTSVPFLLSITQLDIFSIPKKILCVVVWAIMSIIVCSVGVTFGSKGSVKAAPIPPVVHNTQQQLSPQIIRLNNSPTTFRNSSSSQLQVRNWTVFNNLSYLCFYSVLSVGPSIPAIYTSTAIWFRSCEEIHSSAIWDIGHLLMLVCIQGLGCVWCVYIVINQRENKGRYWWWLSFWFGTAPAWMTAVCFGWFWMEEQEKLLQAKGTIWIGERWTENDRLLGFFVWIYCLLLMLGSFTHWIANRFLLNLYYHTKNTNKELRNGHLQHFVFLSQQNRTENK